MSIRTMTLRLIIILSVAAGFFLATHSISQHLDQERRKAEPEPRPVRVAEVENIHQARQLSFSGITRAAQRARLAFSIGGRLLDRAVEIGSRVEKGQILARIDDREPRNAVATAQGNVTELEARFAQNERDRDRVAQLVAAKAATSEELEQVAATGDALKAATDAARARLREAQRLASEAVLRAPFSGTVTQVLQEPGEYLVPGQPVMIVSGDGDIELEVEVPESIILQIHEGDVIEAALPAASSGTVSGEILSVGRSAIGPGRLFPIVARLEADPRLVAGMSAELRLRLNDESGLAIPVEAVINPGGRRPSVFRVVGGQSSPRVERVEVEILHLLDDRVAVRGKLEAGDRVVAAGQHALLDGDTIQIQEDTRQAQAR